MMPRTQLMVGENRLNFVYICVMKCNLHSTKISVALVALTSKGQKILHALRIWHIYRSLSTILFLFVTKTYGIGA